MKAFFAALLVSVLVGCAASHEGNPGGASSGSGVMTFLALRDSVLVPQCGSCHSEVSNYDAVKSWGSSGVLLSNITRMPPGAPLEAALVTKIQAWIDAGMLLQEAIPEITSVKPEAGPLRTAITVTGNNLANVQSVTLGSSPCSLLPGGGNTSFRCLAEVQEAGALPLKVVTGAGFTTKEAAFTFAASAVSTVDEENCTGTPSITSIDSDLERVVTKGLVTVNGSGFKDCTVIEIGDRRCAIRTLYSPEKLDCAPVETYVSNQKVDVVASNGTTAALVKGGFTTPVYPNSLSVANFISSRCASCHTGSGGNPVSLANYNNNLKNGLVFPGNTSSPLIAKGRDPSHAAAKGTYTIASHEVKALEKWIGPRQAIQIAALVFNQLAPNRVQLSLPVRLQTNNFGNIRKGAYAIVGKQLGVSQAYNVNASGVIYSLSFSTPLRTTPGKVDVTLRNGPTVYANGDEVPGEEATMVAALDYVLPPTISSVTPASISSKGTAGIQIAGTNFQENGVTVSFLDTASKEQAKCGVTSAKTDKVVCDAVAMPPGAYTMQLKNNTDLQVVKTAVNVLAADPPTITSITPQTGPSTGKTEVTIEGGGFFTTGGTLRVTVSGVACGLNIAKTDADTIVCTTGGNMTPGSQPLVITNPDGQKVASTFTVIAAPSISSIAPNLISNLETILLRVNGNLFETGLTATIGGFPCDVTGAVTSGRFDCNTNDVKGGETKYTPGKNTLVVTLQNGQQTQTDVTVVGAASYGEMKQILINNCVACHGAMTNNPSGANYDMSTFAALTAKIERVRPGDAAGSLLYSRLTNMPPNNGLMNSNPSLANVIKAWIDGGAPP